MLKCESDYHLTKFNIMTVYIAVPRRITSGKEALRLQGVGEKVASRVSHNFIASA